MALQHSSLDEWEHFIDIPEAIVYLVYSVAKLVLLMIILSSYSYSILCCSKKTCYSSDNSNWCFWLAYNI